MRFPRWRVGLICSSMRNFLAGVISEPERVRAEYERRLQGPETGPEREVKHLNKMIANLNKMISRLIDAYGDGLLDKSEFEPRILAARAPGQAGG